VKVILHAPKNGFFYVIDRSNGKLLSAEKIAKVTWASRIDMETGRPVENPAARYADGEELVWPSTIGAHSWHAMSYNPQTGLAYLPTIEMPGLFSDKGVDLKAWKSVDFRMRFGLNFEGDTPKDWGSAVLLAWDPVRQQKAWSVDLPPSWNPGTLTTAGGLVFQGQADGDFVAYDAATGAALWSVNLGLGISAPPVTYAVDGRQCVSLLVGWGGGGLLFGSHAAQHGWAYRAHPRRLFTFALGGDVPVPYSPPPVFAQPVDVPDLEIDPTLAAEGAKVWTESCLWCHGGAAVSGGTAPDLRESRLAQDFETFRAMVRNGLPERGMPSFRTHSDAEIQQLYHFIRNEARKALAPEDHAKFD
jgi:quinohemoprotein ethanol dehydrogenase